MKDSYIPRFAIVGYTRHNSLLEVLRIRAKTLREQVQKLIMFHYKHDTILNILEMVATLIIISS